MASGRKGREMWRIFGKKEKREEEKVRVIHWVIKIISLKGLRRGQADQRRKSICYDQASQGSPVWGHLGVQKRKISCLRKGREWSLRSWIHAEDWIWL